MTMCGPLLGGFWWLLPLMGALMCLGFLVMAFRFASTGRGFMCMGGHHGGRPNKEVSETGR